MDGRSNFAVGGEFCCRFEVMLDCFRIIYLKVLCKDKWRLIVFNFWFPGGPCNWSESIVDSLAWKIELFVEEFCSEFW